MANKKKHEEKDPEIAIESAIGNTEAWLQRNSKLLLTILCAVVVIVGGYFAYQYLYKAPRQEKAATAMYSAQNAFAALDYELALNGDGNTVGFLQIVDRYGNTTSGNLAKHYVGQCYLKQGDYANAILYFDQYKPVKNSIPAAALNAMNAGLTGDAYAQLGDFSKAAQAYEKAILAGNDQLTTPYYGLKAGAAFEQTGNFARALEIYTMVLNNYPGATEITEVLKAIARVEQKL